MKTLYTLAIGVVLATGFAQGAMAQTATAYDSANCHASFEGGCSDSGNSDAPLPLLGAGPLALAALGAAAVIRRRRRLTAAA